MDKKIFFVLLWLVLFSTACQAQFYILDSHSISISVDSEGKAEQISERYFITFQNEQQLFDFRQTVSEIGASLDGWRSYDSRIYPHIGQEKDIKVSEITFIENEFEPDFLEISYSLSSPLVEKRGETTRVVDYRLATKHFNEFLDGSLWVIPTGTSITVQLPRGAEIEAPVKPDASINGTTVTWEGYVFGNDLRLEYQTFKQISSFDLGEFIQLMMQSDLFWGFVVLAAIVSVLVFAKRRAISSRIEGYVVRHSDLGGEEED